MKKSIVMAGILVVAAAIGNGYAASETAQLPQKTQTKVTPSRTHAYTHKPTAAKKRVVKKHEASQPVNLSQSSSR